MGEKRWVRVKARETYEPSPLPGPSSESICCLTLLKNDPSVFFPCSASLELAPGER